MWLFQFQTIIIHYPANFNTFQLELSRHSMWIVWFQTIIQNLVIFFTDWHFWNQSFSDQNVASPVLDYHLEFFNYFWDAEYTE